MDLSASTILSESTVRLKLTPSAFGKELYQMGISVEYNGADGSSYLALDEKKLREVLDLIRVHRAVEADALAVLVVEGALERNGESINGAGIGPADHCPGKNLL